MNPDDYSSYLYGDYGADDQYGSGQNTLDTLNSTLSGVAGLATSLGQAAQAWGLVGSTPAAQTGVAGTATPTTSSNLPMTLVYIAIAVVAGVILLRMFRS